MVKTDGKTLFTETAEPTACKSCHTLADAGATLDQARSEVAAVSTRIQREFNEEVPGAIVTQAESHTYYYDAETEAMRQTVNEWIRTSGKLDAVADFDAARQLSAGLPDLLCTATHLAARAIEKWGKLKILAIVPDTKEPVARSMPYTAEVRRAETMIVPSRRVGGSIELPWK